MLVLAPMAPTRADDPPLPAETAKLKDENPLTRSDAVKTLGKCNDTRVVPLLLPLLTDDFVFVRVAVVRALGDLHDPRAIDPLLAALEKPELEVGSQVIEALSKFQDPRVMKVLLAGVKDPNAATRAAAITALGNYHDAAVCKTVYARLLDSDANVRQAVVKTLGKLPPDPITGPSLCALLNSETNRPVQIAIVDVLGRMRMVSAVPQLLKLGAAEQRGPEPNYQLVTAVRQAITHIGEPAFDVLLEKMREPVPDYQIDPEAADLSRRVQWMAADVLRNGPFQTPRLRATLLDLMQQNGINAYSFNDLLSRPRAWNLTRPLDGVYSDAYEMIAVSAPRRTRELWCRDPLILARHRARLLEQKGNVAWDAVSMLRQLADPSITKDLLPLLDSPTANDRLSGAAVLVKLGNKRAFDTLIALLSEKEELAGRQAMNYLRDLPEQQEIQPLLDLLKTKPEKRLLIVDILGPMGDGRAVPTLIELLKDHDEKIREHAALALGMIGDHRAVPSLIAAMNAGPEWCQSAAAWALGQIGDKSAVEPLAKAMPGPGDRFVVRAARSLLQLRDERGVEPMIQMLSSKDDMTRSIAFNTFNSLDRKETRFVEPLLNSYRQSTTPEQKNTAITALAVMADSRAVPVLLEALDEFESNTWMRTRVIRALEVAGDRRAAAALAGIAQDDVDNSVATEAALALQALGDPRAADHLLRIAADPYNMGRNSAVAALANLNDPRVTKTCADLLQDDDPLTRALAARALAHKQDPRGAEALLALLEKETEEATLLAAARYLGEAKEARAVPTLLKLLPKATPAERAAFATALGALGDKRAIDPLRARLQDHYPAVRYAAAAALHTLTGQDYTAEANKW